eukprot:1947126-Lingulodinium_polyedra.AAC.1
MWSKAFFQSKAAPATSSPAAPALSSSTASSQTSYSAPRLVGPPQAPIHEAMPLARPTAHTR